MKFRISSLFAILLIAMLFLIGGTTSADQAGCLPTDGPSVHNPFGRPGGTPATNDLVVRELYEASTNETTKFSDWVAYFLDGSTFGSSGNPNWDNDTCIDASKTLEADSPGGDDMAGAHAAFGYQRGHMAANATFAGSDLWAEINVYSNMHPQLGPLNGGVWSSLEGAVRTLVSSTGRSAYVITGPLYFEDMPALPNADESHVVASDFWKIILIGDPSDPTTLSATAFIFDQADCMFRTCSFSSDIEDSIVTIDRIEQLSQVDRISTTLDFFPNLPDDIENVLESTTGTWPPTILTPAPTPTPSPGPAGGSDPLPAPSVDGVIISRLLANPAGDEPDDEWIEVCNTTANTSNISGWRLSDGEGNYAYPTGTSLGPTDADDACLKVFGIEYNPTGNTNGLQLRNSGELLILVNANLDEVDRCEYGRQGTGEVHHC